jgi:hypothetical protein
MSSQQVSTSWNVNGTRLLSVDKEQGVNELHSVSLKGMTKGVAGIKTPVTDLDVRPLFAGVKDREQGAATDVGHSVGAYLIIRVLNLSRSAHDRHSG